MTGLDTTAILNRTFTQIVKGCKQDMISDNSGLFGLSADNSEILLKDCHIANSLSGAHTPVEINLAAIKDEDQTLPEKYVGVIRDVTSQKETERLRDDFIATLTHDLRTPLLAAIVKVAQIMDKDTFLREMRASFHHKFANKPEVIEGNMKALEMAFEEVH